MSLKYFVINVLLCFVIVLVAVENYKTWNHSQELLPETGIVPKKAETKNQNPPTMAPAKERAPVKPWNVIPEKNIFSPDRKDFPIAIDKLNPVMRPQLVLYGITIAGDYQAASVVNPGRPLQKGERETLTVRLGEKIGEYKLAKVLPDRIAMENNGDTFEVLLYDFKNPKKRIEVRTETKPVMISSTQPPPAPPMGETPKPTPSQEPGEKPKEPVQKQTVQPKPQVAASLPYNKYTYQLLGPSAATSRGKIVYQTSEPPVKELPE